MKINARILSYTVLKESISVQLLCDEKDNARPAGILASMEGETRPMMIGDLETEAAIKSVGLRKGIRLLLHLPCDKCVAAKMFSLMINDDHVTIKIFREQGNELLCMLDKVAIIKGMSPQEVLRELTTFKGTGGRMVDGKDAIKDLSPRFQEVVLSKLHRILNVSVEINHARRSN